MKTVDPAALRLAAIVESSDDGIISHDPAGRIETWNRGAERIYGYTPAEIIGRSVDTLVPADQRRDEAALTRRVSGGEALSHIESKALLKNGAVIPVSFSISPVRTLEGEIIGASRIVRDISSQAALQRDALRLAAIVDSSDDAIASKDLNGIVLTWNKAAERMFGFTAGEIVGQSILKIIPPERYGEEDIVLNHIRAGLPVDHFETVRQRKDGSQVEVSLTVSPIRDPRGRIIGASKIARDITGLRRLVREAEDANRIKDEFLATLSHELRTPLNAVLGYTRMLRDGTLGEERQGRAVEVIERNATLLHQLVSDVLDVSAIVTGKMRVTPSDCDLNEVVRAACDSVMPSAQAKGVTVSVQVPLEPTAARCDGDRMQQVFWNLLANAVKFTPRGGAVHVDTAITDHVAQVTVRDTGIGIRPEALSQVFQRFWQGDSVNSRQTGGLGVGLALARHFVELHGGTISVASEGTGKGSAFMVTLPLAG
ncbi:MAG TPA: PAS domain S-box protein [Vicinamibacterales bacterium]|jgi:PAS domain S-box-containing protein|nr:PAS domain S-box protein [Vicinamibacterales bacterium]